MFYDHFSARSLLAKLGRSASEGSISRVSDEMSSLMKMGMPAVVKSSIAMAMDYKSEATAIRKELIN